MDDVFSANLGARRNEDIALDLLKFVAGTAGVGRPAAPSTGFLGATAPKPEEHVCQLLALYGRCLKAVEGKEPEPAEPDAAGPLAAGQAATITEPASAAKAAESPVQAPQGWVPQGWTPLP